MHDQPTADYPPLTAEDVQDMIRAGCQAPGCQHRPEDHQEIGFAARCHPGEGLFVWAHPGEDYVTLRCSKCDALVHRLMLASRTMTWAE